MRIAVNGRKEQKDDTLKYFTKKQVALHLAVD